MRFKFDFMCPHTTLYFIKFQSYEKYKTLKTIHDKKNKKARQH